MAPISATQAAALDVQALAARVASQSTREDSIRTLVLGVNELYRKTAWEPVPCNALFGALHGEVESIVQAVNSNVPTSEGAVAPEAETAAPASPPPAKQSAKK